MKSFFYLFIVLLFSISGNVFAVDLIQQEYIKGKIIEIISVHEESIAFGETSVKVQTLKLELESGKKIEIKNDLGILDLGDKIFLSHVQHQGESFYTVRDIDRSNYLMLLFFLFIAVVLFFGKKQGYKSLISLVISFTIIFYVFIPALLAGHSPLFVGLPIIILLMTFVVYFTHGFKKVSTVAILGISISLIITSILLSFFIYKTKLSGFFSDEATFLNIATGGDLDMKGLLFAGILVGIIGILDDISITQSSVVYEMKSISNKLSKKEVWKKSMNVGRHHMGSLINTLILAYIGVTLPLILYLSTKGDGFWFTINQEPLATEIVRALIGSIGLIITVPITTYLAILFFSDKDK